MQDHFALQRLTGTSCWTDRIRRRIIQISPYQFPVLITGPEGTGKQLIARLIHAHSPRGARPLIPFLADRMPAPLALLQLFGHAQRATHFTSHASLGCMGAAQQGTLLIREVGELDAVAQNLLLEVLKHKRFTPVGALQSQVADVRVIATSCRDLRAEVQNGRFSAELYYRLSSISCQTVPLRDRVEDILPIARQIMARLSVEKGLAIPSLSPAALALLETYDWPGNVNELEQALEAAILSSLVRESETMVLEIDDFPGVMEAVETPPEFSVAAAEELVAEPVNAFEAIPPLPGVTSRWISLQQLEAQHLRATLHHCRYHLPTAARLLGLSLADLRSRIQRHGVRLPLQPIGLPGVRTLPDNLEK